MDTVAKHRCARCLSPAVVLLARDTPPAAPGIKDLSIDMTQWQPLIEDRAFVSWLVGCRGSAVLPGVGCEGLILVVLARVGCRGLVVLAGGRSKGERSPQPAALHWQRRNCVARSSGAALRRDGDSAAVQTTAAASQA